MVGFVVTDNREDGAPVRVPRKRAHHRTDVSLAVATLAFRQRPMRIAAEELAPRLQCTLVQGGDVVGNCTLLDVSAAGIGVTFSSELSLWQGMRFDQVRLQQSTVLIAEGPAEVVEVSAGPERRVGLRFLNGEIKLGVLRLRDGSPLDPGGATPATRALSPDWRAAVAELGQILRWSSFFLDNATRPVRGTMTTQEEQALFADFYSQWAPRCLGSLARLHDLSASFDKSQKKAARDHARYELLGTVLPDNPAAAPDHGVLDDYALPSLFLYTTDDGSTPMVRFIRYAWARFPLVRTILARPRWLVELWDGLRGRRSARVLVVQPGPAAELDEVAGGSSIDLTLLEADNNNRAKRVPGWRGRWMGRSEDLHIGGRPVDGLPPRADDEAPYDLIYGAGVLGGLDDDKTRGLIRGLHERLAPGGRLVLGNLRPEPASSWLLDYVLDWPIHYREVQALGGLVEELSLPAASWHVASDPTGRTSVLDLTR